MGNPARLKSWLAGTFADAGGSLSFEKFMQLALYDPEFGYYTSNIDDVGGARADFSTWATLSPPGKPVANWINAEFEYHDHRFDLIEIGAGDGSMAESILKNFSWNERRKLNYHIVEISGPLMVRQKARIKGKRVQWHKDIESALAAADSKAIIFSNELVDAFPAKWLRWNGENWQEIYISFSPETGLKEEFRPTDLQPDFDSPKPGQRVELHNSYFDWLDSWLAKLEAGSLLTIDYGSETWSKNPNGTMRGYFRQQRIEGPGVYQRFGSQDLTCDVNFSELVRHGEVNHLETVKLENQLEFMQRYGAGDVKNTEAAKAFLTLHQRKS